MSSDTSSTPPYGSDRSGSDRPASYADRVAGPEDVPPAVADLCRVAERLSGGRVALVLAGPETPAADGAGDVPLVDSDGAPLGLLRLLDGEPDDDLRTVATAIATALEHERDQARLFDLTEEVASSEQRLVDAVGQVAHDLNNPLAAAAMSLEIARDQVEDGLVAQLLDRAAGSTARMKRMTEALLTLAHQPRPGEADLAEAVRTLTAELEGLPASSVELVGPSPLLAMAPADLEVVLVALLDNAVKFAGEGVEPRVRISSSRTRSGWRVTVADNGIGIASADAERVFRPTVRLDRRVPGSGMGLTTVRRLVAAAGGQVGVEPSSDGGATVWFEVPGAGDRSGEGSAG